MRGGKREGEGTEGQVCWSGVQDTRVKQREDNDKTRGTKVPGVQGDRAKITQTTKYEYIRGECGRQWWANLDQTPNDLDKTIFRDLSPTPIP